jgi:hypothetical protein
VDDPLLDRDGRALGDAVAADLDRFGGLADEALYRRPDAHPLLDDLLGVRQVVYVVVSRRPVAEDAVGLGVEGFGLLGVRRQQVEGVAQRERGRLVARQEQGDDLVADQLVVDLLVGLARGEQHRHHVAVARVVVRDDAVGDAFEGVERALVAPVAGRRHPLGHVDGAFHPALAAVHHRLECVGDLVFHRGDVGVEQRLRGDLDGQLHHVFVDVPDLPVRPLVESPLGVLGHDGRVLREAVGTERRLDAMPLATPELPLVRQEAVAGHVAERRLKEVPLHERLVPVDEHLLDEFGRAQLVERLTADLVVGDRPVLAGRLDVEVEGVAGELVGVADDGEGVGTGRSLGGV